MRGYKENVTVTSRTMGLEGSRQREGDMAAARAREGDRGTAALPPHLSSVCYQPEFLQGLLFLCYDQAVSPESKT